MLVLSASTDLIQVVTSATGSVLAHASWEDVVNDRSKTPTRVARGRNNAAAITTATTTTLAAGSASGVERAVRAISVRNNHASTSNTVTVQLTDGTTAVVLWKGVMLAGETAVYDGQWTFYSAAGVIKASALAEFAVNLHVDADVTNATTSWANVTGLTASVSDTIKYGFEAFMIHKTDATTTGAQFGIAGPTMTYMRVATIASYTPAAVTSAMAAGVAAAQDTAAAVETTGPGTTETVAILGGYFVPSADGTFAIRCKSEIAVAGGLVIIKGSWLRLWQMQD